MYSIWLDCIWVKCTNVLNLLLGRNITYFQKYYFSKEEQYMKHTNKKKKQKKERVRVRVREMFKINTVTNTRF